MTRVPAPLAAEQNRRLPEAFFLDLLDELFSVKEGRRQLATAIDWGRDAELFGFDDDAGELFLEAPDPRSAAAGP